MNINKLNLLLATVFLLFARTVISQTPYIPQDFNDEPAIPAHTYWESQGQILDMEGYVVEDLRYYTIGTGPKVFAFDDKVSFVHYYTDTIVMDTAWRLDMQFICEDDEGEPGEGDTSPDDPPTEPCGTLSAHEEDGAHLNYYLQHTGAGLEGVPGYHRLVYEDAWPNIDFHLYSNRIGIKFYIVVNPGGDPNDILLKFSGQDNITSPIPGVVQMHLANRSAQFPQAFAWQEDGTGNPAPLMWLPTWVLTGANDDMVSVTTGAYDTGKPLILQLGGDPEEGFETDDPNDNSSWSTYMGDNLDDKAEGVDTDGDGHVYLGGTTESAKFPVADGQSAFDNNGGKDVFTAKFQQSDRKHLWTTITGGTLDDNATSIDHNGDGKVYVVGETKSTTMIPGGFSQNGNFHHAGHGGNDAFLIRLEDNQGFAKWITHFGGSGNDGFYDVYADASNVYVAGVAISSNGSQTCGIPGGTELALCDPGGSSYFQSTIGGIADALVARFDNSGTLTYSTYLGGSEYDIAYAILKDQNNHVIVAGNSDGGGVPSNVTSPCGVPTTGEFPLCDWGGSSYYQDDQPKGFIVRLDAGLQLRQGTYFGNNSTIVTGLDINSSNDLYAVGHMTLENATTNTCNAPGSNSFPVCAAGSEYKETHVGGSTRHNSFIARFDDSGEMHWSTPYGEDSRNDGPPDVAIDGDDNVYMISSLKHLPTEAPNGLFPGKYFPGYYQQWEVQNPQQFDGDATLAAFDVGNIRQWATVFGADTSSSESDLDRVDKGIAIATYGEEDLIIAGVAASVNLYQACPVPGTSYCQAELSDLTDDAFVTQFNIEWLVTKVQEQSVVEESLVVFPNPVTNRLTVNLPSQSQGESILKVFTIEGQQIRQETIAQNQKSTELEVSDLPNGVYLLEISNEHELKSARFIKQ